MLISIHDWCPYIEQLINKNYKYNITSWSKKQFTKIKKTVTIGPSTPKSVPTAAGETADIIDLKKCYLEASFFKYYFNSSRPN